MAKDTDRPLPPDALFAPQARLLGLIDEAMARALMDRLAEDGEGPFVVELSTMGGEAETARRMAADLRLFRKRTGREVLFFGKTVVYSAGITVMAAVPREARWLARGTSLMIHARTLSLELRLDGPLELERPKVEAVLAQIDEGLRLQREGFRALIAGSRLTEDELYRRIERNWYLDEEAALALGLVAGLV